MTQTSKTQRAAQAKVLYTEPIEMVATLEKHLIHDDYTVGHDVTDLMGLPHDAPPNATTKTIRMHDRDIIATDGTLLASLSGMSTTVTKMTDPHDGAQWLFIALTYLVTAHWGHANIPQGLYFKNRDGGPIWSWGFPYNDFRAECGWNNHMAYFPFKDTTGVSWFSDWNKVSWRLSEGFFYPC